MIVQNKLFINYIERMEFKILTVMFNCSIGQAPASLTELLSEMAPRRRLRFSDSVTGCYNVPFNKLKTFGDRSFRTVGPKLWNSLPSSLKNSVSVGIFKNNLKTLYFRNFKSWF